MLLSLVGNLKSNINGELGETGTPMFVNTNFFIVILCSTLFLIFTALSVFRISL